MKLARAIRSIQADSSLTALGIVSDGTQHYAYLWSTPVGVQVQSDVLVAGPLMAPFIYADLSPDLRLVVAKLTEEVNWTLFRGGLPLEDDEAPKAKRRRA
jgi:hypothetical protein